VRRGEISIVIVIEGDVAPGSERVRDVFGDNFEGHGDVGAAVCVYRHGRKVVDLWGGLADAGTGRPWTRDTLQLVYSATKAATATCAHLLAQRGELDLDKPAADYWPEFAAQGKADIPVRWLLSHRAGLPVIDNPLPLADLLAWDPMAAALAAQRPVWERGTAHGYHGRTFGWLVGELIRRVSGRSVGTFFAEEIAGPAGLDFYIGLPAAERGRASQMVIDEPPGAGVADIGIHAPDGGVPARRPGLVRPSGTRRVARLRRPGERSRVRLRGQPHPAGHERQPREAARPGRPDLRGVGPRR
jgi:CubicO group peptidase (beta-lactamase class C family)